MLISDWSADVCSSDLALRASAANDVAGEPLGCRLQLPLSGHLPFECRGLAELGLEVLAGDQVRARLQLEEFFFGTAKAFTRCQLVFQQRCFDLCLPNGFAIALQIGRSHV